MDFSIIIPARYASSRLPAKLLKDINGKTLIEHTYSNAVKSDASRVIIATDDVRIKTIAEDFGAEVCMTNDSHISGTSRLSEVVSVLNFQDDDVVVNLQGDEPMMSPSAINQVASNLSSSGMSVATLCEKIDTEDAYFDENCVKVVYNSRGKAMYFSRSPIPAFRDSAKINLDLCFRHIGLYAYRVNFLKDYTNMTISSLEMAEKLEQLTFLTHGFDIHVETSCASTGYGVDTESDLIKVKKFEAEVLSYGMAVPKLDDEELINHLIAKQKLIKFDDGHYVHVDALEKLISDLRTHFAKNNMMEFSEFRELSGLSRKLGIPTLEYLDSVGYTHRQDNVRVPGPKLETE